MPDTTQRGAARWQNQNGSALMTTFLLLIVFLTLGAGALQFSALELRAANSDHTGRQAFFVAEAGVQHALNSINRVGVIDFRNDVVNRWATLFGTSSRSMPGYAALQYSVQITADPASPTGRGTLTSTGVGTSNARRVVAVGLQKGPASGSPGALYVAADTVSSDFDGNKLLVDGHDHDLDHKLVANGDIRPGIAARTSAATNDVLANLSGGQYNNVLGLGYSDNPPSPSVMNTGGPTPADMNQIITDLLSQPVVDWTSDHVNGDDTLGTVSKPQITHLTRSDVSINGNASGAGILIADGSITINGNFNFVGWIIVRGASGTTILGNATVLGALWTADLSMTVGGSCIVDYSSAAMALADGTIPGGGATPHSMVISSWQEVY